MITLKEFEGVTFESKEAAFTHLRENASKVIALKCAEIHKSYEKGQISPQFITKSSETKALSFLKDGYIYAAINTTKFLDSHNDVHLDGIWNKSVKEQKNKIFYVADHELKLSSVIAFPQDIEIKLRELEWKDLGYNYEGKTTVLFYDIPKAKVANLKALEAIEAGQPLQNSVRMQYNTIKLAMNSTAKEDIEYKRTFDEVYPLIANKEKADEDGYFWAVSDAKIVKEGSLVLFGSNEATPILQRKTADAGILNTEPPAGTHSKQYFFNPNLI